MFVVLKITDVLSQRFLYFRVSGNRGRVPSSRGTVDEERKRRLKGWDMKSTCLPQVSSDILGSGSRPVCRCSPDRSTYKNFSRCSSNDVPVVSYPENSKVSVLHTPNLS